MKITRENLKNIVREAMVEENAYQEFFKKALEKTGKSIPDMSDEEKKAFFNKIDSAWKGKGEKNEGNAFGAAVADAKKDGDDSFKVGGKEYKVESNEEDLDEEAVVVSKRTPEGNIVSKLKEELESTNERMGSDKGAVGNANFNNRLKAMRDDKNSFVAFVDTNKGKKLLKVFKTQQTANQFVKKSMDTVLNTKGIESIGTMSKKEWDAKEAKYAIESVNDDKWRNTIIQSKNIFRMLKQKYTNNIPKMEKGLETILKQNKTKNDQAEVVRQEFKKYFKIK
jgi:hypothetical protein